jgi:hypothetical protein
MKWGRMAQEESRKYGFDVVTTVDRRISRQNNMIQMRKRDYSGVKMEQIWVYQ